MRRRRIARKGVVLIAVGIALLALVGSLGLAYDIGRMYIAKNEAQNYADAAALAAVLELDGTMAGLARARNRVTNDTNRWDYATRSFQNTEVYFGPTPDGPWASNPTSAVNYSYVRIVATAPVPITFLPMIEPAGPGGGAFFLFTISSTVNVNALSDAAQEFQTGFRDGLFPFSPYAHDRFTGPHYGLVPGQLYTLRWASNFNANGNNDSRMCPGDRTPAMRELARSGEASDRGFIESTSSNIIRESIIYDFQSVFREIGDSVNMTGGVKQTQLESLIERVLQDTNPTATNYTAYSQSGSGNGRRIVGVPINSGAPDFTIVQVAAFFLLTAADYENAQNAVTPICGEYLGAWVKGSVRKGATESGGYVVKLVK